MKRILHISPAEKFLPSFIEFLSKYFGLKEHKFLIVGDLNKFGIETSDDIVWPKKNLFGLFQIIKGMNTAEKIILHGLFSSIVIVLLLLQPWLLKKCYWVMWGGDLYVYSMGKRGWKWKLKEFVRRPVIKRMGNIVTYIKGDYKLVRQWYGATGQYHECFMYPSNLYKEYDVKEKLDSVINILVGNSADPTNNHIEVFEKLKVYKNQRIKIYTPLSYGDEDYARKVIEQGKKIFGDKFIPLNEFIPLEQYLDQLGIIDIAIFNHKRQQAMGNIITLLGLGKKIYMRNDVTQWCFFLSHDIKVFNIEDFDLLPLNNKIKNHNIARVNEYFSIKTYKCQLQELFD